jgi:hypothetical protein
MMKFLFCSLLAANGLLFAYQQGYLDTLAPNGREPARMANQLNADKIKLLPPASGSAAASQAPRAAPVSATAPQPEPSANKQAAAACTEIGNFSVAEGKRFESQLAAASLADKLTRREVQELGSHMVLIPPQAGKAGADKKAAELRKLGIADFYVMQDSSPQRWGISLGIFKTEEAARAHLASLVQKGVRSAQVVEYKIAVNKLAFQLRQLDPSAKDQLEKIKAGFTQLEMRDCATDA